MLQIRALTKAFGSKTLFENATVFMGEKARVALIGPNGAGKSTMIKLILGEDQPDEGGILLKRHIKIGHLAQELPKFEDRTIFEEVLRLDGRREEILEQKRELEKKLETEADEELLEAYSVVLQEFDNFDEYRLPSRAEIILEGVGFQKKDFHRNLSELSGGWLMRVALSRVLLLQPDLLILDEPTNHLDLESLIWLEEFLKSYPGSILLVSHDRAFQNRLVNTVWEIDQKQIFPYAGNLDAYGVQKEERLKVMMAARAGQEAKIADMQSFVDRFGAKATKARQAQSRMKQIEKIEEQMIDLPELREKVQFTFPPCPPSGKEVITLKKASIHFETKKIFTHFDWILSRGSRVAIVGVNGAGKTTLLKALTGNIPFTEGSIKLGHQVQIGYYSQLQAESLNQESTIYEELEQTAPNLTISQIRGIAGAFLFSGESVYKKIKVLSGGEKARVALAKLLLLPNNFLLLDEPTNHLDVESREVLLQALMHYEGTLCLVSHDRDFVAPLVDQLLEIDHGRIIPLVTTYEEYLSKKVQETRERMKSPSKTGKTAVPNLARVQGAGFSDEAPGSGVSRASGTDPENSFSSAPNSNSSAVEKKPSNNQIRYWEKELKKIEGEIVNFEEKLATINHQLSIEDFSNNSIKLREIIIEQTKLQSELEQKLSRWEELGLLLN